MNMEPAGSGEILLYNNGGEKKFVSVVFADENFWLSQSGMAELFDCSADNVSLHLKNIYTEEELLPEATTEKFSVVRQDGTRSVRREIDHYNLDSIIAVGYRLVTMFIDYAEFRKKQDADYISEFDRETAKYLKGGDPK